MAANRTHHCPDCGQRWRQRDARFCGGCGALLAVPVEPPRRRSGRRGSLGLGALGAVVVAALLAAAGGLDLADVEVEPDPTVRLDDEPSMGASPLSPAEVRSLRAQADPGRLRCEPRGCELWRLDLDDIPGHDRAIGAVTLDDDLLLIHAGRLRGDAGADAGAGDGSGDEGVNGHRLVALDPTTGEQRWQHTVVNDRDDDGWVRIVPGPHGALVLDGVSVTSLHPLGAVVWRWQLPANDAVHQEVWEATEVGETLVLQGWRGGANYLAGLDPATGQQRWEHIGEGNTVVMHDIVIAADDEQRLRRLDPHTGGVLWDGVVGYPGWLTASGDWLLARRDDRQLIIDVTSGRELSGFKGDFLTDPIEAGGGLVGVASDRHELGQQEGWDGQSGNVRLVRIRPDGLLGWFANLGPHAPLWECCPIEVDDGEVVVSMPAGDHRYDLHTGWRLGVEPAGLDGGLDGRQGPNADADTDTYELGAWPPRGWRLLPGGTEIRWGEGGRGLDVRWGEGARGLEASDGDDAAVTVTSARTVDVVGFDVDRLIVGDGREMMGLRPVPPR